MGKKAVYSNKGLQVYITQEDFEELLESLTIKVPVGIGKDKNVIGLVRVELSDYSKTGLLLAFNLERDAIDKARDAEKKRRYISGRPLPKSNKE